MFLDQARPVVAQRSRSGRVSALAECSAVSNRFRTSETLSHPLEARNDLSHLYNGMRLSTFRNRCSRPRREQRFSKRGTLARELRVRRRESAARIRVASNVTDKGVSANRSTSLSSIYDDFERLETRIAENA